MNSSIQLLRNNFLYILWFGVYFSIAWLILGADGRSLFFCLLFYAVALLIALSPIGEWFIRLTNHARQLETNREIDYLVPIFEEVYDEAKEQYPYLPQIKIFTIDSLVVNACAMDGIQLPSHGEQWKRSARIELKAVIAHEIGHILYWPHNGFASQYHWKWCFFRIRDCSKVCHHNFRPVANTV